VPQLPGTYTVTIGLTDAGGAALAPAGAATASFSLRAHQPYLLTAQIGMPHTLHRGEASLVVVNYGAFAGATDRPLSLGWRVADPRNARTVQQGSKPVGELNVGRGGRVFAAYRAPPAHPPYQLTYEIREETL